MAKIKNDDAGGDQPLETCGVIMPISAMGTYEAFHWADVRRVIYRAIEAAGMKPQIVSDSLETDVIQERIILNLYENPVVICDVSGLNPNVMFELGMRLTFKKPTIIITDDIASLPFDTRIIEHISYPRDLRFHRIEEFIGELKDRILSTREKVSNGTYKSFIESFGKFETVSPDKESVSIEKYVVDRLDSISNAVRRLERGGSPAPSGGVSANDFYRRTNSPDSMRIAIRVRDDDDLSELVDRVGKAADVEHVRVERIAPDKAFVNVEFVSGSSNSLKKAIERHIRDSGAA